MRPRLRLHWLASAWILAGSGCDYWRNLIESKQADKVDLVLTVKDAWTGEALASARCAVDGAEALEADSDGRIALPGSPTGSKTVSCTCASYHDRAMAVEARPGGGRIDIPMARMGGEHWYPDDDARQVRIQRDSGNLVFPGDLVVRGFPGDTTGEVFHYAWSSTHHAGLRSLAKVPVRTGPQPVDNLEFTLTLTVTATLAGRTYEVGTVSQPFNLAKNRPPSLEFLGPFKPLEPVRVGKGCLVEPALLFLKAVDLDGDCWVRIHSRRAEPPLGYIDTTAACSQYMPFTFPISSHDGHPDESLPLSGTLEVEVFDENGGKAETTLVVRTYSNMHPEIFLEQVDIKRYNLTDEYMFFRIVARDRDTKNMQVVKVNWKNGDSVTFYNSHMRGKDSLVDTLKTIWREPGTYTVEAMVEDGCGRVDTVNPTITLVDNRVPTLRVDKRGFNRTTSEYEIRVYASDDDEGQGMDTLRVRATWGAIVDGWVMQDNKLIPRDMDLVSIPFKPIPNATRYEIEVTAFDLFRGDTSVTLELSPVEVFGTP